MAGDRAALCAWDPELRAGDWRFFVGGDGRLFVGGDGRLFAGRGWPVETGIRVDTDDVELLDGVTTGEDAAEETWAASELSELAKDVVAGASMVESSVVTVVVVVVDPTFSPG